jgi:sugar phosphate isomerase/epimerase
LPGRAARATVAIDTLLNASRPEEDMMRISCVTASYVMDLLGYPGHFDWARASELIEESPFPQTLENIIGRLARARLNGIEPWFPHIAAQNLTPANARRLLGNLEPRGMSFAACAGGIADPGTDPDAAEEAFQIAALLKTTIIAGHMPAATLRRLGPLCARYGVKVAFENGGEKSADEIKTAFAGCEQWAGAGLDTGNMATHGGDPVRAARELGSAIIHVHLKDVPAVGSDDCVALGTGIVDIRGVLSELKAVSYQGWLSIEVETSSHDPTDAIIASAETVRGMLGGHGTP